MKRIITVLFATGLFAALTTGCKEQYTTYSDAEYVMFSDTSAIYSVLMDQKYFSVPVTSTVARDYDRTFGVEIIDKGNTAIEGQHYRLQSNTITIKAGTRSTNVNVQGIYDQFEPADTLHFTLKLVVPEQLKWDIYPDQIKVGMLKRCPYDQTNFTGWCVVSSMFLNSYPGVENKSIQRLIHTRKHPTEENTIILSDWLFSGYDVTIRIHPDDPDEPLVTMDNNQVLADEGAVFGQIQGDGKILVTHSPLYSSYFNTCKTSVSLWIKVYVENLGESVGVVGHFFNIIEWVSDEEAERLQREEGMLPGGVIRPTTQQAL